ncbi:MAG TPA: preprotein translocase YidC [Rugosimonospora sp.]
MSHEPRAGEQPVEREAAEPPGGAPPSLTEVEKSRRPAIVSADDADSVVEDDGSGMAGGASGSSSGGSGTPGHPDAHQ